MNISEIKKLSIKNYLASIGCTVKANRGYYGMYLSPYRKDSSPSLKVDYRKNLWHDFGVDEGGSIIDLVMKIEECTFTQAIENLSKKSHSFSFHCQDPLTQEQNIDILKVKRLENRALLQYLESRKINLCIAQKYCEEIYYEIDTKRYFAIALKNKSLGYEVRNKYFKGCIGRKDITYLTNNSNTLLVFEGLFDFLSLLTYNKEEMVSDSDTDTIILNSISNITEAKVSFDLYQQVDLYLDNDIAGINLTKQLLKEFSLAGDCSFLYRNYKDLNDFLIAESKNTD